MRNKLINKHDSVNNNISFRVNVSLNDSIIKRKKLGPGDANAPPR